MKRSEALYSREVFEELTPEQYEKARQFLINEGMAWEDTAEDPTWVAVIGGRPAQLNDLEAALA